MRNHIFIVNGIINEVVKEKKESIQVHIYDLIKAFEKINLEFAMNDLCYTLKEHKIN